MKYPRTIKKYKINSCVEPKSYKSNENLEGGSEQKDVEMQQKIQRDQGDEMVNCGYVESKNIKFVDKL